MSKLQDTIRKVQSLIALADHPNTPTHEADSARSMAEALMFKYRLDELSLTAADRNASALSLSWAEIDLCERDSEFRYDYMSLAQYVCSHLEIRGCQKMVRGEHYAEDRYVFEVVGFESDIQFASLLITAARLAFSSRLEPKFDASLSHAENAYLMRLAGMEGRRIAMAIYGSDEMYLRPKVRKMFRDEALRRGEDPTPLLGQGVNVKLYRESFAQGFTREFYSRLLQMAQGRGEQSVGLVLTGRKEMIDEAYYAKYPHHRPQPAKARIGNGIDECAKCAKAKSGYCAEHRSLKPSYGRRRVRYADPTGIARGREAARSVDLGYGSKGLDR